MLHHAWDKHADTYPHAILVKQTAFNIREIEKAYIRDLEAQGIDRNDIIVIPLPYNPKGKAPVKFIKSFLEQLMPNLLAVGTKHVYCADANYFKVLAKQRKAEPHLGYVLQCGWEDCEHMEVVLGINHKALMHNPAFEPKLTLSVETFAQGILGTYTGLGADIIQNAQYPRGLTEIQEAMLQLWDHPELAVDIEAFSLHPYQARVGTTTFCWNKHEGIAFACDYEPLVEPMDGLYGRYVPNQEVRKVIRDFLENYRSYFEMLVTIEAQLLEAYAAVLAPADS